MTIQMFRLVLISRVPAKIFFNFGPLVRSTDVEPANMDI